MAHYFTLTRAPLGCSELRAPLHCGRNWGASLAKPIASYNFASLVPTPMGQAPFDCKFIIEYRAMHEKRVPRLLQRCNDLQ